MRNPLAREEPRAPRRRPRLSPCSRATRAKRPHDTCQVLALEKAAEEREALYLELTHWSSPTLPPAARWLLVIGALAGIVSCHFSTWFSSRCFEDFELYPEFDVQLREVEPPIEHRAYALCTSPL